LWVWFQFRSPGAVIRAEGAGVYSGRDGQPPSKQPRIRLSGSAVACCAVQPLPALAADS